MNDHRLSNRGKQQPYNEETPHHHHHGTEITPSPDGAIDPDATVAPNPGWLILKSVGIDVGSSTSHLTFSKLFLERQGVHLSSRFIVVRRDILYRSKILLTPYRDHKTIDVDRLSTFLAQSYRDAGIEPSQIDTGAVICTGEAVKKENAEAITRMLSATGGNFVCATAGPRLEGILAAHGSGAVARAKGERTLLHVDVGGGTCKATFVCDGKIIEVGAINVGARLFAWDAGGELVRIEKPGEKIAKSLGIQPRLGKKLFSGERQGLARTMADMLFELLRRGQTFTAGRRPFAHGPAGPRGTY